MIQSEKLYLWLRKVTGKLIETSMGRKIFDLLEILGVRLVIIHFYNWRIALYHEKHPTEQMMNSRIFFKNNKKRIKAVLKLLSDDFSKDVFIKMIYFRCYSKYKQLPDYSIKEQYFVNDFFKYYDKEVYIDCGAYNGDSINGFKKVMKKKGRVYSIVAFEPDYNNYKKLLQNHKDIVAFQSGVWNMDGELVLTENGTSSTFMNVDASSTAKVTVKSIDNVIECKNATFIKMDVEGSEYNALLGAEKVIRTNKPKLAICIYHSDEDMLRLIELIHEMVPEYHFYIRQHNNGLTETVLYAQC